MERLRGRKDPALVSNHVVMLLCDMLLRRKVSADQHLEEQRDNLRSEVNAFRLENRRLAGLLGKAQSELLKRENQDNATLVDECNTLLRLVVVLSKALDIEPDKVYTAHQEGRLKDLLRSIDGWDGPLTETAEP